MPDIRIAVFDTETTGVDPKKNGITQIALELGVIKNEVYHTTGEYNFTVRPFPTDVIEEQALKVQGRTREEVMAGEEPRVVYRKLLEILGSVVDKYNKKDKMFFVAYNGSFDMDFLRSFWMKNGDEFFGSFFFYPDIDVCRIAGFKAMEDRPEMQNFKLGTVADHFGIERPPFGDLHDASVDLALTLDLFLKFKGVVRAEVAQ